MQLRWYKRRDRRPVADSNTSNIATKNGVIPVIHVMMTGVARCRDRPHFNIPNSNGLGIVQDAHVSFRNGREPSPQSFHVSSENARSGFNQTTWINQVRRAARMHVNRRSGFSETVSRSSMIEMNMTEKNVAHIDCLDSVLAELGDHIAERRFRPGIEEDDAVVSLQRRSSDNFRAAQLQSIDDVWIQSALHKSETGQLQMGKKETRPKYYVATK